MSKLGGTAVLVAAVLVAGSLLQARPDDDPPPNRAPRLGEARLVGYWDRNRDMSIRYTAGGVNFPEIVERISPFEHVLAVKPGETVTFTVTPLAAAAGKHRCVIEYPPGRPLPGSGQATASGSAPAFCSAVIGA